MRVFILRGKYLELEMWSDGKGLLLIVAFIVVFNSMVDGEEYPCTKPNRGCRKMVECKDRRQCKTIYGDSPLDIALYGQYQPCHEYGKVRCLDHLLAEESSEETRPSNSPNSNNEKPASESSLRPGMENGTTDEQPNIGTITEEVDATENQQIPIQYNQALAMTDTQTSTDAGTISSQDFPPASDLDKPATPNQPDGSQQPINHSEDLQEEEPIVIVNLNDLQEDVAQSESVQQVQEEATKPDMAGGHPPAGAYLEIPTLAFVPVEINRQEVLILASVVGNGPLNQPGAIPYPRVPVVDSSKGKIKALKGEKNALWSLIRNKFRLITRRRVATSSI